MMENATKLAPPGAGIPLLERLAARHLFLGPYFRKMSWEEANEVFLSEGRKILERVDPLSNQQMNEPRLIDRMKGLEDSSRFWSVSMTLEHLMIVGTRMGQLVVALSQGRVPPGKVDTADVKPHENRPKAEIISGFEKFLRDYEENAMKRVVDRSSRARFRHPWFGPLTAHQWHCMAGIHQGLHRKQVHQILKRF